MIRVEGTVEATIKADTVVALKAGDRRRAQALRLLTAALKKSRIDAGETPTEQQETVVLKRERKRRAEAAVLYEQAGRDELAAQERFEEEIIAGYLPEELGDDELAAIVDRAIAETGASTPKDMGKVMGAVMKQVAGRADGGTVNQMVRTRLGV
ncbi:MAG TPA: GatB/YqeY domain-containing protein [Thermoleophilia bacterium]|nr:GatB/YqeY domain-containing protein [Thermoleophilia bacterium]